VVESVSSSGLEREERAFERVLEEEKVAEEAVAAAAGMVPVIFGEWL